MPISVTNLFTQLPEPSEREHFESIVRTDSVRIERIVSTGQCTPAGEWLDQERDEWVAVLRGSASLRFEDGDRVVRMSVGDSVLIPARHRHRVESTDPHYPTVWLAVHFQ